MIAEGIRIESLAGRQPFSRSVDTVRNPPYQRGRRSLKKLPLICPPLLFALTRGVDNRVRGITKPNTRRKNPLADGKITVGLDTQGLYHGTHQSSRADAKQILAPGDEKKRDLNALGCSVPKFKDGTSLGLLAGLRSAMPGISPETQVQVR